MSEAVDYRFVNDLSQVDVSEGRIMPALAQERGAWDGFRALEAEDQAFVVEAAVERFGDQCLSHQDAYRKATRVLSRERFSSCAGDLVRMRGSSVFAKNLEHDGEELEDRFGTPEQGYAGASYADLFGIEVETTEADLAAWTDARVLDPSKVAMIYRDLRRYQTAATLGKVPEIVEFTPSHSGVPIAPEQGPNGEPAVWGWKSNGPSGVFPNASAMDVFSLQSTGMKNAVTVAATPYENLTPYGSVVGTGTSFDWARGCVDFAVHARAKRQGGSYSPSGAFVDEWYGGLVGVASKWVWLERVGGYNATFQRGRVTSPETARAIVEHYLPGWGEPWAATDANVAGMFFGGGFVPSGLYMGDWTVEVCVTISIRVILCGMNYRTGLEQYMDYKSELK